MLDCLNNRPQTFQGLQVVIMPDRPKMQLSERVKEVLSPEFIEEINAWMLEFFGVDNMLEDGQVWTVPAGWAHSGMAYMNPRTYARLRAAMY